MAKEENTFRRRTIDVPPTLLGTVKKNVVAIAAIILAASTIALAPIHFDERYAHADDVAKISSTLQDQTRTLKQAVVQQQINWLEYYNDRIKSLELSKSVRGRSNSEVEQINRDIDDIKSRKVYLEKSLVESTASK